MVNNRNEYMLIDSMKNTYDGYIATIRRKK